MLTPSTDTKNGTLQVGGNLFMLVMDAQGKPLALAPLEKLGQSTFPADRIRLIRGETVPPENSGAARPVRSVDPDSDLMPLVESALRRLYDLGFLADHPLARLNLVSARLATLNAPANSIARAKIVRALLRDAVEQLRPEGPLPVRTTVPRREWHPYLILECAYFQGEQNYDIMNWLQLSEGTFNRTRRRALQMVAQVVAEMEQQVG
jgi:hypothetical protein